MTPLSCRGAGQRHRQRDIAEGRQRLHEVEALKDGANPLQPVVGQAPVLQILDRHPANDHPAGGRTVEAADQVEQRRFAAAGGSHDRHELARSDRQAHAVQRRHRDLAHLVDAVDVLEANTDRLSQQVAVA